MLGALLALASAAFFGLNNATARRAMIRGSALQGMAITVPLGVPFFCLFALFLGGFGALAQWHWSAWGWMSLAGVMHFVIGRYGNYRATHALGATLSTPVQQLSILIALALAVWFLDEEITPLKVLGIVLIVFGPMVVLKRRNRAPAPATHKDFHPRYLAGFVWGIVCAVGYGVSPLFIVYGLGADGGVADGVAGVLVSYAAATIVVLVLIALAGGRGFLAAIETGAGRWFLASAAFVAISQLFRYIALALAPVSVVVPVQRLSVIFRLVFSALLNRDYEIFDAWVVITIVVSVLGAVMVTIDAAWLASHLPLPAAFGRALF